MADAKEQLQYLMHKVKEMRHRQVLYFKSRDNTNLNASKTLEKEVDAMLLQLQSQGFTPTPKPTNAPAKQVNFFDAEDGQF